MELNRTTTNKQTLRNLTNPFYLEVVMNRVNEVINHITRPTYTKSSRFHTKDETLKIENHVLNCKFIDLNNK